MAITEEDKAVRDGYCLSKDEAESYLKLLSEKGRQIDGITLKRRRPSRRASRLRDYIEESDTLNVHVEDEEK